PDVVQAPARAAWHSLAPAAAATKLGVDPEAGLDAQEVGQRLETYGRNELPTEPPPGMWTVARAQLSNPMNIMLLIVAVASLGIGQIATGLVVAGLVTFNVVMHEAGAEGARQRRGTGTAP